MAIRKLHSKSGVRYEAYFRFQGRQISRRFKRRSDAAAWEPEEKKRLREEALRPAVLMYSDLSDQYLSDCENRMQPGTVQEKFRHHREFAAFKGADFPAGNLTVTEAKAFIARVCTANGPKAANRRLRSMKACWNAHRESLPVNPWSFVQQYQEDEAKKYVPPPVDVNAVIAEAEPWEVPFLLLMLSTGARVGELFKLTWEDVNFERDTVTLWTRKRKGGSKQSRRLPLTPRVKKALLELHKESTGAEHVFINPETGGPYHRLHRPVRYLLQRLCKKAEVRPFGFHALRHFVATRLIESNQANIVEIQQLLGHQRTTTTDLYLRSLSSGIAHLADVIEETVLPAQKQTTIEG